MKHLDETDVRLLAILQSDGRITNADLAKRVGLSPPSVLQAESRGTTMEVLLEQYQKSRGI